MPRRGGTPILAFRKSAPIAARRADPLRLAQLAVHDMTTEATITKLMWVLGRSTDIESVRSMMGKDMAGEMTE